MDLVVQALLLQNLSLAGGADIVAWDDNPEQVAKSAERRYSYIRSYEMIDWGPSLIASYWRLVFRLHIPSRIGRWTWHEKANIEIIGDIEIFSRERASLAPNCAFIAITGTNGKSTTTALISHIIAENDLNIQMGGNIGTAVPIA
ncbi:hypothetical protein RT723_06220 [Psychrosphaera aquimarina]|uniref:Mur ligase central domain-containing protein n=1 Tax=Psychrosphaera aquimarina TaxID=2044854 RepID=A0ABU3QYU2_9GAMM|nr:hypothetical protein [Psychrosphaera aquimarina]MDU0112605.1 hypothetical protein [Psychrosphaera aquimarina]